MKICISSTGKNLKAQVDPRFGRCPFFLIGEGENFKAIPNPGMNYGGGAGVAAAQLVASQKAKAVIAGNVGPNAFAVLNQAGIKIYTIRPGLTCQEAQDALEKNELEEIVAPSRGGCGPGGMPPRGGGRGMGPMGPGGGMGQGRGQGRGQGPRRGR